GVACDRRLVAGLANRGNKIIGGDAVVEHDMSRFQGEVDGRLSTGDLPESLLDAGDAAGAGHALDRELDLTLGVGVLGSHGASLVSGACRVGQWMAATV